MRSGKSLEHLSLLEGGHQDHQKVKSLRLRRRHRPTGHQRRLRGKYHYGTRVKERSDERLLCYYLNLSISHWVLMMTWRWFHLDTRPIHRIDRYP